MPAFLLIRGPTMAFKVQAWLWVLSTLASPPLDVWKVVEGLPFRGAGSCHQLCRQDLELVSSDDIAVGALPQLLMVQTYHSLPKPHSHWPKPGGPDEVRRVQAGRQRPCVAIDTGTADSHTFLNGLTRTLEYRQPQGACLCTY